MVTEAAQQPGGESFGALLRRHRVAAALSQEALAARAELSTRAVSDLERGVKTRPYLDTVRRLATALDLKPTAQAELALAARPSGPLIQAAQTAPSQAPPTGTGLPVPPIPLIGRDAEIRTVTGLLRGGARLVTLTGPGGVGKTRLALAVARQMIAEDATGVAWVDLAPLTNPAVVASAVAQAVGVREQAGMPLVETLRTSLRGTRLLLVLDNCEHLRHSVGELMGGLLGACPELRVLLTSRAPLRLRAEHVIPIEPLGLPDDSGQPPGAVVRSDAVDLFVARARAALGTFDLTEENVADVVAICRRLDGLPLALELAAARLRILSPAKLRVLLETRLRLLVGGPSDAPRRHRTLRDTITWSYELLTVAEQTMFRQLAVFAGSASLEAVAQICTAGDPFVALEGLEALVDEGLLRRIEAPGTGARVAMWATIRDFALESLEQTDETGTIRRQHAAYFLDLAEEAEAALTGPQQREWWARLDAEHDNLRGALAWAVEQHEAETAVRMAAGLWRYWDGRGYPSEGRQWLERALNTPGEVSAPMRARALNAIGNMALDVGDYPEAREAHTQALRIRRVLGDRTGISDSLSNLGLVAQHMGDLDGSRALHEQALAIRRETDYRRGIGISLMNLGNVALEEANYPRARALHAEAWAIRRELGDSSGMAFSLYCLGRAILGSGEVDAAQKCFDSSLQAFEALGDRLGASYPLHELAHLAYRQGDLERAEALFRTSLTRRQEAGDPLPTIESVEGLALVLRAQGDVARAVVLLGAAAQARDTFGTPERLAEQAVNELRTVLGDATYLLAWKEGNSLALVDVVALILAPPTNPIRA